jgi:hypothetical protein
MYLTFNPFTLRKRLREYINKYAKQARVIVHLKGNLAKLHHENDRLLRENHQFKRMIKEKDERITQMHTTLTNNLDLARTIEFNSLPRKMKREIERQIKRGKK